MPMSFCYDCSKQYKSFAVEWTTIFVSSPPLLWTILLMDVMPLQIWWQQKVRVPHLWLSHLQTFFSGLGFLRLSYGRNFRWKDTWEFPWGNLRGPFLKSYGKVITTKKSKNLRKCNPDLGNYFSCFFPTHSFTWFRIAKVTKKVSFSKYFEVKMNAIFVW